ncbi:hypothetical protein ACLOJK_020153 [Asimina triloba]
MGATVDLFLFISVALYITSFGCVLAANTYNVAGFGAIGNGRADDSRAFQSAWKTACDHGGPNPSIFFPGGTFLLKPMTLNGPCMASSITILVEGNLVAPNWIQGWNGASNWLIFHAINGLRIQGRGKIGGQGSVWWPKSCFAIPHPETSNCLQPPTVNPSPLTGTDALSFDACNDLKISGVTLADNPRNHISINDCFDVHIYNIFITAPADSPNTDGINVGNSQQVYIWDSTIATGDDCIAILTGTSNVEISGVNCGPGHGISIGSLGLDGSSAAVEQVHVQNCIFNGTLNGARIKTWQGGSGYARGIIFEDMHMNNVQFPIIIDQYYCNNIANRCANKSSSVRVSDVRFVGFHGTSSEEVAVKLACSESAGCTGIVLDDIKLSPSKPGMQLSSLCVNAHGTRCPYCLPKITCLI